MQILPLISFVALVGVLAYATYALYYTYYKPAPTIQKGVVAEAGLDPGLGAETFRADGVQYAAVPQGDLDDEEEDEEEDDDEDGDEGAQYVVS